MSSIKNLAGPRSQFKRYFILILIPVTALLGLFSFYIYRTASQNYARELNLTDQGILVQTSERVDTAVSFVQQLTRNTLQNSDIIETGISPSAENRQRNFSVLRSLEGLTAASEYINKAWLYEHTKGYVFSSDSEIASLAGLNESAMILCCLYSKNAIMLSEKSSEYSCRLVRDGEDFYIVYDVIYSFKGPLLTLIVELEKDRLFGGLLSAPPLDIFDVLVKGSSPYPVYTTRPEASSLDQGKTSLSYTSSKTGWTFCLFSRETRRFSFLRNQRAFIPYLALLLLVSLILTYFITRKTYFPLKKLTDLVWKTPSDNHSSTDLPPEKVNEFTFLENAYQKLIYEQGVTSGIIEEARPDLESKIFASVLMDKEMDMAEIDEQFRLLHSAFRTDGHYQVLLLHLKDTEGMDLISHSICDLHVKEIIRQIFRPEWGDYIIVMSDYKKSIIIQYPQGSSAAQARRTFAQFSKELEAELEKSNLPYLPAAGKLCSSLSEIRQSAQETANGLRQSLYYQSDEGETNMQPASLSDKYYASIIRQIEARLAQNDLPMVKTSLSQFLGSLSKSDVSIAEKKQHCEHLLNVIIEYNLKYTADSKNPANRQYISLYETLRNISDEKNLAEFMAREIANLMDTLETESRKSQNRLIANARDYIADNYSNCDLSVGEIAENIGCTPSYLSAVFSEYTGENLVSYLNSYRVEMAKKLLMNSHVLIRDIGFKTGFNTVQNFNRVFKKTVGITPNEYRKTYQQLQ